MSAMLSIGVPKETVTAARQAVMAILAAKVEPDVHKEALITFRTICEVSNATVQHCTFTGNGGKRARTSKK